MQWFSADYHFSHIAVLTYSNRPFSSVKEMDDTIINNVNKLVKQKDTLYYLGDFTLSSRPDVIRDYRNRIKCENIVFIFGNHDKTIRKKTYLQALFRGCYDLLEIKINDQPITLCHYAMRTFNKSHFGAYQLHAHSHNNLPEDPNLLSFDVGVDCWDYKPINFEQVQEKMSKKQFRPVDHHTGDRKGLE